ncbi:MAG: helix-turn-helix transcriptional regulator [Adlercreutzia sp.]|nr:helix-turn-helix transcriptional regulator [Adlercreutzia sp.]
MSFIRWFCRTTPQVLLVIAGLSCALVAMEVQRMPAAHIVSFSMFAPVPYAFEAVAVAALCLYARRPGATLPSASRAARAAVALLAVASTWLLLLPVAFGDTAMLLVRVLYRLSTGLLVVFWAERLLGAGAWRGACLIAASFLASAVLIALMAALSAPVIDVVLLAVPLASGACLVGCRGFSDVVLSSQLGEGAADEAPPALAPVIEQADRPLPRFSFSSSVDKFVAVALLALPLICRSPMVSTQSSWMSLQEGSLLSLGMQLSIGAGTALGAVVVALIIRFCWNRSFVLVLNLIVLPLSFVSFYTSQLPASLFFLHFLIIDSTYKVTLFYVMMAPFLYPVGKGRARAAVPLYLAFAFMIAMRALFSGLAGVLSPEAYATVGVIVVIVSFVGAGVLTLLVVHRQFSRKEEGVAQAAGPADAEATCDRLARRFDLTPREREILGLLARNYRAPYIAEKLVVSQSTVKTHMRNLYAKLGVHSQAELLLLVEQEAESL